jgi:deazaflavin-dependent oxidoreductase (nitroreductase family)
MATEELKRALQAASEIEVTVTGRRSGREITNPVWFVQEDDELYLLPVRGSDTDWYRNVLKNPTIRIAADGVEASVEATPITDAGTANDVVEKFRAKYGASDVERYYPKHDVAVEVPLGEDVGRG